MAMAAIAHPRIPLNQPALRETLRDVIDSEGTLGFVIAIELGFTHYSKFSALVNADEIVATPLNIKRLEQIAQRLGFPKSRLFLDAGR
jgi:hypothetical protein